MQMHYTDRLFLIIHDDDLIDIMLIQYFKSINRRGDWRGRHEISDRRRSDGRGRPRLPRRLRLHLRQVRRRQAISSDPSAGGCPADGGPDGAAGTSRRGRTAVGTVGSRERRVQWGRDLRGPDRDRHELVRITGVCSGRNIDMVKSLGTNVVVDYAPEDFVDTAERYDLVVDIVASRSLAGYQASPQAKGSLCDRRRSVDGEVVRFGAPSANHRHLTVRQSDAAAHAGEAHPRRPGTRTTDGRGRSHQTTWCTDRALDFMAEERSQPWLMSVNYFDPHAAFDPPQPYLNSYEPHRSASVALRRKRSCRAGKAV